EGQTRDAGAVAADAGLVGDEAADATLEDEGEGEGAGERTGDQDVTRADAGVHVRDRVQDDDAPVAVLVGNAQRRTLGRVAQAVGGDRLATTPTSPRDPRRVRADVALVEDLLDHQPDGNADQERHAEDLAQHDLALLA